MTERITRALTVIVVLLGTLLRTAQYSSDRSLWLDEIAIARNVQQHSVTDLLVRPLDYEKVAPKGFLAALKGATTIAGTGDHTLRAVPFFASVGSLILFAPLSRKVVGRTGGLIALTCFAFAVQLISQSAEVKQYSTDVAATVLLMWLALRRSNGRRADITAGLLGGVAVWFSQPAVMVAIALAAVLVADAIINGRRTQITTPSFARVILWVTSACIVAAVALSDVPVGTRAYMQRYWVNGFPPLSIADTIEILWPWNQLRQLFGDGAPGFYNSLAGC